MAKAKKKAARKPMAKAAKAKTKGRKPAKAMKPKARTTATKKKVAKPKAAKKAARPVARKVAKKGAKPVLRSVPSAPGAGAMKTGYAARPVVRDEHAGIRIAAVAPERIASAPRPERATLRMPFVVPVERPIAPIELRPAPQFRREMSPHDDEE